MLEFLIYMSFWLFIHWIGMYYFAYYYSEGIIKLRYREETNERFLKRFAIALPIGVPVFVSLLFTCLGSGGSGIAWGCHFENLIIHGALCWVISVLFLGFLGLFALIKPSWFSFKSRSELIEFYVYYQLYMLLILVLTRLLVPLLVYKVPSMGATCM